MTGAIGAFDLREHRRHRAEVDRQACALAAGRLHAGEEVLVGGEIGLAPGVDRLLGIADDEEPGARAFVVAESERGEQLALAAVGVLELVDEQLADLPPQPAAHRCAALQQSSVARSSRSSNVSTPARRRRKRICFDERPERLPGELEASQVESENLAEALVRRRWREAR